MRMKKETVIYCVVVHWRRWFTNLIVKFLILLLLHHQSLLAVVSGMKISVYLVTKTEIFSTIYNNYSDGKDIFLDFQCFPPLLKNILV